MKKLLIFFILFLFLHNSSSAQNISSFSCGPIPPVCTPGHVNPQGSFWIGLHNIHLAQINRTITDTSGYLDYSCSDSTYLVQGNTYQFTAITEQTYEECIRAWLDFNNDGAFDTTEIIFADSAIVYSHAGYVTILQAGILNTPLRLRVASDYSIYPPVNACLPVQYGNYIDLTVYLDGPDAISEAAEENSFIVSPNPFSDKAQIYFKNDLNDVGKCRLKIYDITGSLVKEEEFENLSSIIFNREHLPSGLYYFCLCTENKMLGAGKLSID